MTHTRQIATIILTTLLMVLPTTLALAGDTTENTSSISREAGSGSDDQATSSDRAPNIPPNVCIDVWEPVCGADGQTYPSACVAAAAGVEVAYEGVCSEMRG